MLITLKEIVNVESPGIAVIIDAKTEKELKNPDTEIRMSIKSAIKLAEGLNRIIEEYNKNNEDK